MLESQGQYGNGRIAHILEWQYEGIINLFRLEVCTLGESKKALSSIVAMNRENIFCMEGGHLFLQVCYSLMDDSSVDKFRDCTFHIIKTQDVMK